MTMTTNNNDIHNVQFDLNRFPATRIERGIPGLGVFLLIFSLFWGGIPTIVMLVNVFSDEFNPMILCLLFFTLLGALLFCIGLNQFFYKRVVTIDEHKVHVESQSMWGRSSWTEQLDRYKGILAHSEYHSGGKNSPSYTLYIVELYHDQNNRKIVLYQSRSESGFRKRWEDCCRKLNMKALEESSAGLLERNVDELDKSVREQVRDGSLRIDFDPSKPPPEGLKLHIAGEYFEITIMRKKNMLVGLIILLIVCAVFIGLGIMLPNFPVAIGGFFLFFLIIVVLAAAWEKYTFSQIRVSKNEVQSRRETPWGIIEGDRIDTSNVESVKIAKDDRNLYDVVVIASDDKTICVGDSLPLDMLNWLKNCILAIISK